MPADLKIKIEKFFAEKNGSKEEALELFHSALKELEKGTIRAAEKNDGIWRANSWVKEVILLGFKYGTLERIRCGSWDCYEKNTLPLHNFSVQNNIRIVPGGSSVRCGSYVADGTVIMPPSYVNIGAYIDYGSMIDSHALVGSCAQIGKNVHISAAVQIGGVLEPVGAVPVIIEDGVFIGGNSGIYEGVIVKANAVIASGVILNSSVQIFDNTTGEFIKKIQGQPLTVPANAVVIAGTRPLQKGPGAVQGIHIYCPVIIKYRDAKTDRAVVLEEILRHKGTIPS